MSLGKTKYLELKKILAKWNPLEVPDYVAEGEYSGYIPLVVNNLDSVESIEYALIDIIDRLGLEHDNSNLRHINDVKQVSYEIWSLINGNNIPNKKM